MDKSTSVVHPCFACTPGLVIATLAVAVAYSAMAALLFLTMQKQA